MIVGRILLLFVRHIPLKYVKNRVTYFEEKILCMYGSGRSFKALSTLAT